MERVAGEEGMQRGPLWEQGGSLGDDRAPRTEGSRILELEGRKGRGCSAPTSLALLYPS